MSKSMMQAASLSSGTLKEPTTSIDPQNHVSRFTCACRALFASALLGMSAAGTSEAGDSVPVTEGNKGSLFMIGGGKISQEVRDAYLKLAGGEGKARVVVISTADPDADDPTKSAHYFWPETRAAVVDLLHTLDPEEANKPEFSDRLRTATAAWIVGGKQSRLSAAYAGTHVQTELRELLKRGGVVGGTSAGTAMMPEVMIESGNPIPKIGTGFGLLEGVIVDQHFKKRNRGPRMENALDMYPGYTGFGIDEGTALVVSVDWKKIDVLGDAAVHIYTKAHNHESYTVQPYTAGQEIRFPINNSTPLTTMVP